jgi:anti-sigma regulatory factor (Ser/Thr protein kinase)
MHEGHAPRQSGSPFECDVPASTRSLAGLRARFTGWLTALGVADRARCDLVLTISELAAAALDGATDGEHWLRVGAWSDDDGVAIEVSDDRGAIDSRVRGPDPGDRGPGLAVVATLADLLAVREVDGGRSLRASLRWENLAPETRFPVNPSG